MCFVVRVVFVFWSCQGLWLFSQHHTVRLFFGILEPSFQETSCQQDSMDIGDIGICTSYCQYYFMDSRKMLRVDIVGFCVRGIYYGPLLKSSYGIHGFISL